MSEDDSHDPGSPGDPNDADKRKQDPLDPLREKLFDALFELEDAASRAGWEEGFDVGWDSGWKAALEHLAAARMERPEVPPVARKLERSANEIVLGLVTANPGLRGVELVAATKRSRTPLKERTVRTALHRLKMAGQIKSVGGRWYPSDSTPAPNPMEGDMDPPDA